MADLTRPQHVADPVLAAMVNAIPDVPGHAIDAVIAANKRLKVSETAYTATNERAIAEEVVYRHSLVNRHIGGGITQVDVDNSITAACGPGGAISNCITNCITAACGPGGDITTAVTTAIDSQKHWLKNEKDRAANSAERAVLILLRAERGPNAGSRPPMDNLLRTNINATTIAQVNELSVPRLNHLFAFYQEPSFSSIHTTDERREAFRAFLFDAS